MVTKVTICFKINSNLSNFLLKIILGTAIFVLILHCFTDTVTRWEELQDYILARAFEWDRTVDRYGLKGTLWAPALPGELTKLLGDLSNLAIYTIRLPCSAHAQCRSCDVAPCSAHAQCRFKTRSRSHRLRHGNIAASRAHLG